MLSGTTLSSGSKGTRSFRLNKNGALDVEEQQFLLQIDFNNRTLNVSVIFVGYTGESAAIQSA